MCACACACAQLIPSSAFNDTAQKNTKKEKTKTPNLFETAAYFPSFKQALPLAAKRKRRQTVNTTFLHYATTVVRSSSQRHNSKT